MSMLPGRHRWTSVAASLLLAGSASVAVGDEGWLTRLERDFFASLTADAAVAGRPVKRAANPSRIREVAGVASQPLRGRMEAVADRLDRIEVTPDEQARHEQVMKRGRPEESWAVQAAWLERGASALAEADEVLAEITDDLERRTAGPRPRSGLDLGVLVAGKHLKLEGTAREAIRQPIFRLVVHKKPGDERWTSPNVVAGILARSLGDEWGEPVAGSDRSLPAGTRELATSLPLASTQLLPDIAAGDRISVAIGLPAELASGIDRIEFRLWGDRGWFGDGEVRGLAGVQVAARESPRRKRTSTVPLPFFPMIRVKAHTPQGGKGAALPRPAGKPVREAAKPAADDAGRKPGPEAEPTGPPKAEEFTAFRNPMRLVLTPQAGGSIVYSFPVCTIKGKGYQETGKEIDIDHNGKIPLMAIAEGSEHYVVRAIDRVSRSVFMILVPKPMATQAAN